MLPPNCLISTGNFDNVEHNWLIVFFILQLTVFYFSLIHAYAADSWSISQG